MNSESRRARMQSQATADAVTASRAIAIVAALTTIRLSGKAGR